MDAGVAPNHKPNAADRGERRRDRESQAACTAAAPDAEAEQNGVAEASGADVERERAKAGVVAVWVAAVGSANRFLTHYTVQ